MIGSITLAQFTAQSDSGTIRIREQVLQRAANERGVAVSCRFAESDLAARYDRVNIVPCQWCDTKNAHLARLSRRTRCRALRDPGNKPVDIAISHTNKVTGINLRETLTGRPPQFGQPLMLLGLALLQ
jgi:hypothetical protein